MGVSTRFYTKNAISIQEAKELIEKEFNCVVTLRIVDENKYRDSWAKLAFTYNGEMRDISYFPYSRDKMTWGGDEQIDVGEHGYWSFSKWGSSVEIMTRIGEKLGGWLDENDCDEELDVYICNRNPKLEYLLGIK